MRILGFDPGLTGAVALIDHSTLEWVLPMPIRCNSLGRNEIDALALFDLLVLHSPYSMAIVEQQHSRPTDSRVSCFSLGGSYQKIKAVLEILKITTIEIAPQIWKAAILHGSDRSKEAAIGYVRNYFPNTSFRLTPCCKFDDHNLAEAALLALYGATKYRQG